MRTCFFLILISFCLISCQKEKIQSIETNNSRDSLTYQPATEGSTWQYNRIVAGLSSVDYNFICTGRDTVINSKTYRVYSNDVDGTQFLRRDVNKYYQVLTASTNKPELLVLDADKNVGESWVGGINGSDTYTYTMKEKIPAYVLDGFTFRNVLVIRQVRTNTSGATTLDVDTHYAQGVGLVKTSGTVSGFSVVGKLIRLNLR